jgi:riboflavin synthase
VRSIVKQVNSWLISVGFPKEFTRSIVPVGSIAIDGISLTVAALGDHEFTVSIIPHTLEKTTIASVREGSLVNLEFDIIGKYVERLLEGETRGSRIDAEKLRRWGYDL